MVLDALRQNFHCKINKPQNKNSFKKYGKFDTFFRKMQSLLIFPFKNF